MSAEDDAKDEVLRLSSTVWNTKLTVNDIDRWLDNFTGSAIASAAVERINALQLLSQFMYFGSLELRVLLRALYRDLFAYPIIQQLRAELGGSRDRASLESAFESELLRTRFLGMGNPSESGVHLLYYFRQVNRLNKDFFVHQHELFDGPVNEASTELALPDVHRLVFIDDLLGSGQQSGEYSSTLLADIDTVAARTGSSIRKDYLVLFAKDEGLEVARRGRFDRVDAVHVLDDSQKAFDVSSRAYAKCMPSASRADGQTVSEHYGARLFPGHPLGYRNGQMLIGFHHNIPDNTLPIFWANERDPSWETIFERFAKEVPIL